MTEQALILLFRMSFDDWVKNFHMVEIIHLGPRAFARLGFPEVSSARN